VIDLEMINDENNIFPESVEDMLELGCGEVTVSDVTVSVEEMRNEMKEIFLFAVGEGCKGWYLGKRTRFRAVGNYNELF
jgi:hypothetical protein